MSQRTSKSKSTKDSPPPNQEAPPNVPLYPTPNSRNPLSQTLTATANLANLLPTGTLLAFQLLTPSFTNNGSCDAVTRALTQILLTVLASSAFLACFTDSFTQDGNVYYGLATRRGMWVFDYPTKSSKMPDLSEKRLRFVDFVHAVLSVLVFVSVALRDRNVVACLYPRPEVETKEVLDIVPVGVGLICSLLFVVFPTRRHGIGFPVTNANH